jgi:glutamine synthetase
MAIHRFRALEEGRNRPFVANEENSHKKLSDIFGQNVFGHDAMRDFMAQDAFESVMSAIEKGIRIDRKMADNIAASMKSWAATKGATHYTHWFQPLTGSTAEKHDTFFEPVGAGRAIERFGGDQLVQQEPDASSFPSGGIRNTFEARGYTAWDPTSPAFVFGNTLCIPTIYVSYTGEALDYKTPLLKSLSALDKAAVDVCQYFDKHVTKVNAILGWEQEYFLIDEALYNARPDLQMSGRTLFGHASARGHQLNDHYFGSIPERATVFMRDFEIEALKLGIPVKTRHNEVAPNQFECAPVFEECNLAVDHNQLIVDVMNKVAKRHKLCCLMHEQPFAGVNGNSKHNNWSMLADTGVNLLSPGKTPKKNLKFLTFFINTIKAVHDHPDLMRASVASANNDLRLGSREAPPAIMSVFLGSQLSAILEGLEADVKYGKMSPDEKTALKLGIGKIPDILLDNTDSNRTSPFAFTGNKFEFRSVGSSANCAGPMTVLNTIVADQLVKFKKEVDILLEKEVNKDEAIFQVLRQCIVASQSIRFEGNGYSKEWEKEAKKRGLSNITNTPEALLAYTSKHTMALFKRNGVMTEREQLARFEINLETYTKKLQIESRVMADLVKSYIIPTAIKYQSVLIDNVRGLKDVLSEQEFKISSKLQLDLISEISTHMNVLNTQVYEMVEARKKANSITDLSKQAVEYCEKVKSYFDVIRYHTDKLELILDDEYWPLPKYRELLFAK